MSVFCSNCWVYASKTCISPAPRIVRPSAAFSSSFSSAGPFIARSCPPTFISGNVYSRRIFIGPTARQVA